MVVISRKQFTFNETANPNHSFDTGSAWENMALQGHLMGLVVHGIGGFYSDKARAALNIPDSFAIDAMIVVGKPGDPALLTDRWKAREVTSQRRPLNQTIAQGAFTAILDPKKA
jgi:nitroreductase